jgi:hypothetical protein
VEQEKRAARSFGEQVCSPAVIRVLARESRRAVIGEVDKIWLYSGSYDESRSARVMMRLKDDLKPGNLGSLSALQDYSFSEALPAKEKVGDRFILFFKYENRLFSDNDRMCERLPATEENIEAVRRGAAEDWADHTN